MRLFRLIKRLATFRNLKEFRADPPAFLRQRHLQEGDTIPVGGGLIAACSTVDPPEVQAVLKDNQTFIRPTFRRNGKPYGLGYLLGRGLLTNPDHYSWLARRRMMQPMFHKRTVHTMVDKIAGAGRRQLDAWADLPDGAVVEVHEAMMHLTLDVIMQTMFSTGSAQIASDIGEAVEKGLAYAVRRQRYPINLPLFVPTTYNRDYHRARTLADRVVYGLIEERRAPNAERPGDLLDMLLEAEDLDTGARMTDGEIRDEVLTTIAAGHETTANALTWTWLLLHEHPQVLGRLRAELDAVLGGRAPTAADLEHLPYTLAVLEESMRLYPPIPLLPRKATAEAEVGGIEVPPGKFVLIPIAAMHRHPDHWPEPDAFRPERFLPENRDHLNRMAYIPFGAGQRLCIGQNLALVEGQVLLAMMAQQVGFTLEEGHPVERVVAVTMRPAHGIRMHIQHRSPQAIG